MKTKKLLCLLLAIVMVFSALCLAACEKKNDDDKNDDEDEKINQEEDTSLDKLNGMTPYEAYLAALDTNTDATNLYQSSEITLTMSGTLDGEQVDITMLQTSESIRDGQREYTMDSETMSGTGFTAPETKKSEEWFVDGYLYTKDSNGNTSKESISYTDYKKRNEGGIADTIKESWFSGVRFEQESSKKYSVSLKLSDEDAMEIFGEVFSSVSKADFKLYFTKDGEINKMTLNFKGKADGLNTTAKATFNIDNESNATVTLPEGAEAWGGNGGEAVSPMTMWEYYQIAIEKIYTGSSKVLQSGTIVVSQTDGYNTYEQGSAIEFLRDGQKYYISTYDVIAQNGSTTDEHTNEEWFLPDVKYISDSLEGNSKKYISYANYKAEKDSARYFNDIDEACFAGKEYSKDSVSSEYFYVELDVTLSKLSMILFGAESFESASDYSFKVYFDHFGNIVLIEAEIIGTSGGVNTIYQMEYTFTYDADVTASVTAPAGGDSWALVQ